LLGAHSAPPDPLAGYKGTFKGREERKEGGRAREGMGPTSKVRGEGRGKRKGEEGKGVKGNRWVKWKGRLASPRNLKKTFRQFIEHLKTHLFGA